MLQRRGRELFDETQRVMKFYGSVVSDIPYPSFTLAIVERDQPGGHSPPYFAALSHPPPATPISWRTDPAYFDGFPEFFLAHETAHQWWGQAVGWKNYHEQWISEGFAQYFAALYAEHIKKDGVFRQVIAQMARWTLDRSDQGPGLSRLPARPHPQRRPRVSRARLQQGRAHAAHAAQADRRRRVLPRAAALLFHVAVQEGGHRRREGGVRARGGPRPRPVLRSMDLRFVAAAHEVQLHGRTRCGRRAFRADRRALRGAGHGHAEARQPRRPM